MRDKNGRKRNRPILSSSERSLAAMESKVFQFECRGGQKPKECQPSNQTPRESLLASYSLFICEYIIVIIVTNGICSELAILNKHNLSTDQPSSFSSCT
jgi:hypothetical protein